MAVAERGGAGRALAWLAHPVTVVATAVLVVNDHLLKGLWPGGATGKLSDVVGLVMAPALLTVVLTLMAPALRGAVAAVSSTIVVGVGFGVMKGSQAGAEVASAVWSAVSGPSLVVADPTDLLALPALGVAWWTWRRVRGHPAPDRFVRLVRVCVVLPTAALATMATSANPPPPDATSVGTYEANPVVETPGGTLTATDGMTWQDLDPAVRATPGAPQACVPDRPTHCYRVVAGRLAVEESDDGMASWRIAWEISEGRRAFLIRGYAKDEESYMRLAPIEERLTSRALVVVGSDEHHVVVVANGPDGYLVRDSDGSWVRAGFLGDSTYDRDAPLTLTAPGLRIYSEYVLGLGVAAALFSIAVEVARRRRGTIAWFDKIPQCAVAIGLGTIAMATTETGIGVTVLSMFGALFLVPGLVVWLVLLFRGRILSPRQVVRVVPLVLLAAAAVIAPFVGWSAGWPDDHRSASQLALAGGATFAVVALLAAWRSRRWAPEGTEHLIDPPWPALSPYPQPLNPTAP